ncbi:MAG: winged helix-turn-helix domain-containing protein [Pseudomonadota bacterium]
MINFDQTHFGAKISPENQKVKAAYAKPSMWALDANKISNKQKLLFCNAKYIYINDSKEIDRLSYVMEIFQSKNHFKKFQMISDVMPKSLDPCDIIIVGGNDAPRLSSFMRANIKICNQIPKICMVHNLPASKRASILNAGFDDVIAFSRCSVEEASARICAIVERYRATQIIASKNSAESALKNQLCDTSTLSPAELRIFDELFRRHPNIVSYETLMSVASKDHIPISKQSLAVAISKIRQKLRSQYYIKSIKNHGYCIFLDN